MPLLAAATIGCWRRRRSPAAAAAAAVALAGAGHGGDGHGGDGHGGDGHGGDGEGDSAGEGEAGGTAAPQPTACFWPRWMGGVAAWLGGNGTAFLRRDARKFCSARTDARTEANRWSHACPMHILAPVKA